MKARVVVKPWSKKVALKAALCDIVVKDPVVKDPVGKKGSCATLKGYPLKQAFYFMVFVILFVFANFVPSSGTGKHINALF